MARGAGKLNTSLKRPILSSVLVAGIAGGLTWLVFQPVPGGFMYAQKRAHALELYEISREVAAARQTAGEGELIEATERERELRMRHGLPAQAELHDFYDYWHRVEDESAWLDGVRRIRFEFRCPVCGTVMELPDGVPVVSPCGLTLQRDYSDLWIWREEEEPDGGENGGGQ